jgi:hypothetical protein
LKGVNKAHNTFLPIADAVRRIQARNITVWAALLAGFDDDRPDVFDRYRALVREANIGMVIPGLLQAVPGTAYYRHMQQQDRLIRLRNRYVGGQAGSLDSLLVTNVKPRHMTEGELLAGYRRFARDLYEYDAYADRLIGFLSAGKLPERAKAVPADFWDARGILGRLVRHYIVEGDAESRRFVLRIFKHLLKTRLHRVEEAIFHMVIYKHLREFYFTTARAAVPQAEDLSPVDVQEPAVASI